MALILSALSFACSKSTSKPADLATPASPIPALPSPITNRVLHLAAPNETAVAARTFVRGQLQRVQLEFSSFAQRLSTFESMDYEETPRGDWIATVNGGQVGCITGYLVRRVDDELLWRCFWDGTCGLEEPADSIDQRTLLTTLDGKIGRLDEYWLEGPGRVIPSTRRVEWEVLASSATWRIFSRETDPPTLSVSLTEAGDAEPSLELRHEASYRWNLYGRWDGGVGRFALHRWSAAPSRWELSDSLWWDGDHGAWIAHPATGSPSTRSW
ncbi:MAG: hypothetical protein U0527_09910 [Candidatus Eisenbacteria bacterium]